MTKWYACLLSLFSRPLQAMGFVSAFFAPLKATALGVGFLVMADMATGIWASWRKGKPITSDRFSRTLAKTIVYLLAVCVAHVAETYVFGQGVPVLKVVAGIIGTTEMMSFAENVESITGVPFRKRLRAFFGREQRDKEDR